jgi:membrane-bound ClpP family serine protease
MSFVGQSNIGQVFVQTTNSREHTVEEIAERAVNRALRAETQEALKLILIKYLQEAQDAALKTARRKLIENGFSDATAYLGD